MVVVCFVEGRSFFCCCGYLCVCRPAPAAARPLCPPTAETPLSNNSPPPHSPNKKKQTNKQTQAIKRGAPRRAEEARKKIALYTAVHQAMQRRRNGGMQLPTDSTAPILDEHLRSMLSRETIEDVEGQPSTSGRA